MSKKLVAYFSTGGFTADAAKKIAEITGAEIYEIKPAVPYTEADLNWKDESSRSSVEMKNKSSSRPAIADKNAPVADSDAVFLGFPIWWYTAPTIINTFLESYDFSGKKIVLFATSGSTDFGSAKEDLKKSAESATIIAEGTPVHGTQDAAAWKKWAENLGV